MPNSLSSPWWKNAVIYQVYPRSFADANGDGVGDLPGLTAHLDHLQRLGIDALWLSPVYRSPMCDAGYDICDYTDVDPLFGTLADLDNLIEQAHQRGLKVLLDFVPNHTSDQHPWFIESRSSRDNPKRDWYIWRDQPNNWRASINGGSTWTWDDTSQQYYLHFFLPQQPDLNWRNPEVVAAMQQVLHFWLERGVDGFRIDVVHCVGKDPNFADDPRCMAGEPMVKINDQPYSHEVLRGLRRLVDSYPGDRVLIGEVNIRSTAQVAAYYGASDELHMSFNFPPLDAPWDPVIFRLCVREVENDLGPLQAWPTWVLSNHDNSRHRSRYGGSLRRARAAAVMLLTLRGTPFIYQGEELGLEDTQVSAQTRVDPGGRDGSRAPLPWLAQAPHGWGGQAPWLPFPPDAGALSVEAQEQSADSTLALYRQLLACRRDSPALRLGAWEELASHPQVLAYRRHCEGDERLVCINFADSEHTFPLAEPWRVELASDGQGEGQPFSGRLAAEQALVLCR
ncbi:MULTISPECIES: alpha-amylase family glycosyl hydrolase [Pseudomonas]|uniref:Trehalose-6-phosphate hydrolase, putative n=1 Tax=Pseudomonas fluorescens (strain Q2-87) TaxID=1038922 RepID=J2F6J8_PSEFQ|nr:MULTISPECIES: alpha-amylase family glycosyl hydrolase [Pseudomonas]EJL04723.1 trehalose-6-phosphate hydrolase, putative [Pseudomonas fluorescens Q2-87]